jgi:hypothetical protein
MSRAASHPDPLRVAQVTIDRAKRWPIGQPVTVTKDDGTRVETLTRSEPWTLANGTWVILLDGISGCYALARVEPR